MLAKDEYNKMPVWGGKKVKPAAVVARKNTIK